jgi:seryl-tRNA synthetase
MNSVTTPAIEIVADDHADSAALRFRDELFARGFLIRTGENGVCGTNEVFERVIDGLTAAVRRLGADLNAEMLHFPPAMRRTDLEDSEYLRSFPQLAGSIHSFCGDERGHHRLLRALDAALERSDDDRDTEWMEQQAPTRLMLAPAACYPVYPLIARRGPCPADGYLVTVTSYCFRHEPSVDPSRMQMFRQYEYIRVGTPEQVTAFRQQWMERSGDFYSRLQLPFEFDVANDPFFGRAGKIVANNQREQALKFELLVPVANPDGNTACGSFNYHQDHFGLVWKIRTEAGEVAHTACIGFGLERTALALLRHHGFDVDAWPAGVRNELWGEAAPAR